MADDLTRREFVKLGVTGAAALAVARGLRGAAMPSARSAARPHGAAVQPGRQASIEQPDKHDVSIAIINRAIDLGVNYIDTAARTAGPAPPTRRRGSGTASVRRTLASDGHETEGGLSRQQDRRPDPRRLPQAARAEPEAAQDRPPRLWQLHNVQRDEQVEQIFAKDAPSSAAQGARSEDGALCRHHRPLRPGALIKAIERFDFDTILMALNPPILTGCPSRRNSCRLRRRRAWASSA